MKVYGLNADDVRGAVAHVSRCRYGGNLELKSIEDCSNSRGKRATFTLRVADSQGMGAKGSASFMQRGNGPNGLRATVAACWHAHYDVIYELAKTYIDDWDTLDGFRVVTALATYKARSLQGIREQMADTASINVGAPIAPTSMTDLCDC